MAVAVAFLVLAIPAGVVALAAFRLPEPPRGQYERQDVLGTVVDEDTPARISMEAAFSRLLQINTLRSTIIAFAAMGFGLFTTPVLASLFLEQQYGLGSFGRGAVMTVGGVAVLAVLPFVGRAYDRMYRRDPAAALRLMGLIVLPAAAFTPVQYFHAERLALRHLLHPRCGAADRVLRDGRPDPHCGGAVPAAGPRLGARFAVRVPRRRDSGGALLAALLTNAYGPRVAVFVSSSRPPSSAAC